jgi:hypothetical protein
MVSPTGGDREVREKRTKKFSFPRALKMNTWPLLQVPNVDEVGPVRLAHLGSDLLGKLLARPGDDDQLARSRQWLAVTKRAK